MKCKIRSQGVVKGSCDLILEFWDPLLISGTVEARNFKFGMHVDNEGHKNEKKCKIRSHGVVRGYVTFFLNFRTPSISREWLKLETSNLAGI